MKKYIYIDECGDPEFYGKGKRLLVDKQGYQPLLIMGMVMTNDRRSLYEAVKQFQDSIVNDPMYQSIPSINKPKGWYLHAKDDHPEVRAKFFELLRKLDGFEAFMVIGRKHLDIFNKKHNGNATEFYFDLLYHLLKNRFKSKHNYQLYLAHRKKNTLPRFKEAIDKAIAKQKDKEDFDFQYDIVKSNQSLEMSIVDYLNWALQRYIIKGEGRFFKALQSKYSLVLDLYDKANYKERANYYWREHPFGLDKASDFGIDRK